MANFIQNNENDSLSQLINELLKNKTKSMDFLIGYFYFSGMKEIYQNLKDQQSGEYKPMRILVGLDIDHDMIAKTAEFSFFATQSTSSREQIRNDFYTSLRSLFNGSSYFENDETAEAFKIYYEMIKEGQLVIKKTKDPCHAKMYIFDHKDNFVQHLSSGDRDLGEVITGSSNFTYSGLQTHGEINVDLRDDEDYKFAKQTFEELWNDAIAIADKDHIKDFEEAVIKQVWLNQRPNPYLMYLRVLYEYFQVEQTTQVYSPSMISSNFMDLRYQEDAISEALQRINTHNGVIIADVVGLGKSIIGSTVAFNLNMNTIIIAPPHLVSQWEDYRVEFRLKASVFSRGNMEKVLDFYQRHKKRGEKWLIIVDEAHRYRNEFIKDYAILHEICKGNKVMLLTATPFNNAPADIYSMIKLFQNPTKSTLQTVDNLGAEFTRLIGEYKEIKSNQRDGSWTEDEIRTAIASVGSQIRRMIEPIVIRRSRTDLGKIPAYKKDLQQQGFSFPNVMNPELLTYELEKLEKLYVSTLLRICPREDDIKLVEKLDGINKDEYLAAKQRLKESPAFQAARYKPLLYLKPECRDQLEAQLEEEGIEYNLFMGTQRNLAAFMRTLLVRRFESSQYAFKISLESMLSKCENIVAWIEKRQTVPVFKSGNLPDINAIYESSSDTMDEVWEETAEEEIQSLKAKGMFEIKIEYLNDDFLSDLKSDIKILIDLKKEWAKVKEEDDPKLKKFIRIIKSQLENDPTRKIIVFSQFADTVDYLGNKLFAEGLPVFAYTSAKANDKNKEYIKANFDAGYPIYKQADQYKVLIATDAISEGYNLHRAGTIFNYDIPYNPTRVIQRVGRINRINKKVFEELYIFNFFPTNIGESETHTKEISTLKMAMIHAIMGEDTKYLTTEEELQSFMAKQYATLNSEQEAESWDTQYRVLLGELEGSKDMQDALALPMRSKVRRLSTEAPTGILAFAKKGTDFVFKYGISEDAIKDISPEDAFKFLEAQKDEQGFDLSSSFNCLFDKVKRSLFVHESEGEQEKAKRDAIDKIRIIARTNVCDTDYLEDLQTAIERDSLSGYSLRAINRLKKSEYAQLPEIVSREYVQSALESFDSVTHGAEMLIVAEEFQNANTDPQIDLQL